MNKQTKLKINQLTKSFPGLDQPVLNNINLSINIIIECKSPKIKITQETFNQISRYNFDLKANFLVVTNGIQHFCCKVDYQKRKINFLKEIPNYSLKNNYEQS